MVSLEEGAGWAALMRLKITKMNASLTPLWKPVKSLKHTALPFEEGISGIQQNTKTNICCQKNKESIFREYHAGLHYVLLQEKSIVCSSVFYKVYEFYFKLYCCCTFWEVCVPHVNTHTNHEQWKMSISAHFTLFLRAAYKVNWSLMGRKILIW